MKEPNKHNGNANPSGNLTNETSGLPASNPSLYKSPYEAYPFLRDPFDDLRCDFEILTDELTSLTGLLRAEILSSPQKCEDFTALDKELLWIGEIIYHLNPTLRTRLTVTTEEINRLAETVKRLEKDQSGRLHGFVLPQGTAAACTAHLLRVKCKALVRLLYRHAEQGHEVPPALLDAANLLSGYFFALALHLNARAGVEEIPFKSRNY